MVEQYLQNQGVRGLGNEALLGMTQDKFYLFARHAGEPFQKFVDPRAAFEIFK